MTRFFSQCMVLAALLLFVAPQPAKALSLSPLRQTVVVDPGTEMRVELEVQNDETLPLTLSAGVDAFSIDPEHGTALFGSEDIAIAWVKPEPASFSLAPGEKQTVQFRIAPPEDALPGSHYLGLLVEMAPGEGQVAVGYRVASLLYVHVAGALAEEVEITRLQPERRVQYTSQQSVYVGLKNTGNFQVVPEGQVEVFDWRGQRLQSYAINPEAKQLLRGAMREDVFSIEVPFWFAGPVLVQADVRYGVDVQDTSAQTTIWVVQWPPVALLFFVLLFLALFVRRRRAVQ